MEAERPHIVWFATQGAEHLDAARLEYLLEPLQPAPYRFDRGRKLRSAIGLFRTARAQRPALLVMEGTGIAGGATLVALKVLFGVRYVVSSGDAVGPFWRLHSPLAGLLGSAYERRLCRHAAGYVGWTPYLAGRALTLGAPRAMTAPGWARARATGERREAMRRRLGIAPDAQVVGLVGNLAWNERTRYVYGAELVRAVRRVRRRDVVVCVVGDGSGRQALAELAGDELGSRVLLPGRVPSEEVPAYLEAFDAASLSQSVDGVGSFRYTTKLSEYLAAGLPVISTQVPVAYDLDDGCFWRLPGDAPWSDIYLDALVDFLEALDPTELLRRREALASGPLALFDAPAQRRRVAEFIGDILREDRTG